jgi:hypothetical protein
MGGVDWIGLTLDMGHWRALVNTVMNLQVAEDVEKFLSSFTTGGHSSISELHRAG